VKYVQTLWRVESATLACLIAFAVGLVGVLSIAAQILAPGPPSWEGAWLFVLLTLFLGVGPAVLFFAPAYALLKQFGRANFLTAVLVGVLPVIAFYVADPMLWPYALIGGALVSVGVHAVMRRVA
jgi:hypothetical protein